MIEQEYQERVQESRARIENTLAALDSRLEELVKNPDTFKKGFRDAELGAKYQSYMKEMEFLLLCASIMLVFAFAVIPDIHGMPFPLIRIDGGIFQNIENLLSYILQVIGLGGALCALFIQSENTIERKMLFWRNCTTEMSMEKENAYFDMMDIPYRWEKNAVGNPVLSR